MAPTKRSGIKLALAPASILALIVMLLILAFSLCGPLLSHSKTDGTMHRPIEVEDLNGALDDSTAANGNSDEPVTRVGGGE